MGHAQEAGLSTPPELRDFRLDPPPGDTPSGPEVRPPLPQQNPPESRPSATPPPTESAPIVREPIIVPEQPEGAGRAPSANAAQNVETTPEANVPLPKAAISADVPPGQPATQPEVDTPEPAGPENTRTTQIAALAALLITLISATVWIWRRRKVVPSVAAPPLRQRTKPVSQRPIASAKPITTPAPKPAPARSISMTFAPEQAVVSFSSLTIKGKLHIANANAAAADDLVLNAALISASTEQQTAIDSFFANSVQHTAMPLASIEPGQNIDMPLELGIALNQMQTFSLQARTLLAPILVVKLSRILSEGTPQEVARLVCIIGRESTPPQPKMAPLRLDQGPRSFDRLGQRALVS